MRWSGFNSVRIYKINSSTQWAATAHRSMYYKRPHRSRQTIKKLIERITGLKKIRSVSVCGKHHNHFARRKGAQIDKIIYWNIFFYKLHQTGELTSNLIFEPSVYILVIWAGCDLQRYLLLYSRMLWLKKPFPKNKINKYYRMRKKKSTAICLRPNRYNQIGLGFPSLASGREKYISYFMRRSYMSFSHKLFSARGYKTINLKLASCACVEVQTKDEL